MQERESWREGDVSGPARGDVPAEPGAAFADWDNPEDEGDREDAPEGYYDEDGEWYMPGPDDPDYDLSEAAGYAGWQEPARSSMLPGWLIAALSILLILAILTPVLLRIS